MSAGSPPICPQCGSADAVPIAYGLPSFDMFEEAERGEVALGGCIVSGNDPAWQCTSCKQRFGAEADSSQVTE
jgi:hypothetical protein